MADGTQHGFNFPKKAMASALRPGEIVLDFFAGGGGASEALRQALLVTVTLHGTPYVIVDIGLRMLRPHELYRAQGFPPGYIIDRTADGSPLSISASVRMVGNSVSPPPLAAIARANLDQVTEPEAIAA